MKEKVVEYLFHATFLLVINGFNLLIVFGDQKEGLTNIFNMMMGYLVACLACSIIYRSRQDPPEIIIIRKDKGKDFP